jgi:hypothetical protein
LASTESGSFFFNHSLRDGLPFFKRELVQMIPQSLAKGCRIVDDLWPMDTLLPRVRQLLTFLLKLWPRGSEFLTPRLELTQGDHLGLIGIQQALVLPLEPRLPWQPWRLLHLQPGEVLFLGCRPGLTALFNWIERDSRHV